MNKIKQLWQKFNELGRKKIAYVVVVIVALSAIFLAMSSSAKADGYLNLGYGLFNQHTTTGEISYRFDNDIELSAGLIGEGGTQNGFAETTEYYSATKFIGTNIRVFGCSNFYRLGIAHVADHPLVGPTNFRIGAGLQCGIVKFEYAHMSSADIYDNNTGIDFITFGLRF